MRRLLIPLVLAGQVSLAHAQPACPDVETSDFSGVSSKREMEEAISAIVRTAIENDRNVDWECLSAKFDSLGDDFYTEFYKSGDYAGGDILRFTFDRSNVLTPLLSAPGASNMVYTAIVKLSADGSVAIVRRGGKIEILE